MSSLHYLFLLLGLVAVSLRHVRAISEEELAAIHHELKPILADCLEEFGVTKEEVLKAKSEGKKHTLDPCLFGCFGWKFGMINKKGEFDVEYTKGLIKKFFIDEEEQNFAIEIIEKCSSVNDQPVSDDKGCERALLVHDCLYPYQEQFSWAKI